jgi:hypothetical protein
MKIPLRGSYLVVWVDERPRSQIPSDWPKITIREGQSETIIASFYDTLNFSRWIDDVITAHTAAQASNYERREQ